jgi:hypothetical protein
MQAGDEGERGQGGYGLVELQTEPKAVGPRWIVTGDCLDVESHRNLGDAHDDEQSVHDNE